VRSECCCAAVEHLAGSAPPAGLQAAGAGRVACVSLRLGAALLCCSPDRDIALRCSCPRAASGTSHGWSSEPAGSSREARSRALSRLPLGDAIELGQTRNKSGLCKSEVSHAGSGSGSAWSPPGLLSSVTPGARASAACAPAARDGDRGRAWLPAACPGVPEQRRLRSFGYGGGQGPWSKPLPPQGAAHGRAPPGAQGLGKLEWPELARVGTLARPRGPRGHSSLPPA